MRSTERIRGRGAGLGWVFAACLVLGADFRLPAQGESEERSLEADPLSVLRRGPSPTESGLTPAEEELLIDKVRIAEETFGRVKGLKELGNPHLLPGLLLRTHQDDPSRSRVDLDELREKRIRVIERRGAPPPGHVVEPVEPPVQIESRPAEEPPAPEDEGGIPLNWVVMAMFSILLLGGIAIWSAR
jgi:hypothetical protein